MHILHIINNLNKGGAERLLVDNLPLYKEAKINVEILQISNKNSEPTYIKLLQKGGVNCHHLSTGSLYNPILIIKLIRFLTAGKFDVVHVHLFPALYWVAIASWLIQRKPKLIFTEHSTQNKRSKNSLFKPVERIIYRSYDQIIAISDQIQQKLVNWTLVSEKIRLIRNGVDTEKFTNANRYDGSYFYESFSIPEDAVKILMTARFSYPKDHITLVSALSQLPDNYYLILVGEGPNKLTVEQHARQVGIHHRLIFAGFRNDIPSLMKSVDLNILSTEYEGMSGVSLEALASGTPFLGSDVPGINDLVPDSRYLFNTGVAEDLAQKIREVIEDDSLNTLMRKDGVKHALDFDVSINIREHLALYSKAVNS